MPKKYRLTGEEIKNLSGKRLHGRLFSFLVAPITASGPKCAVVVSKKTAAKAVERNKIKRRTRNLLAKHLPGLQKRVALVLYAKREAKTAEFSELAQDIDALFSKL
ncbi:MAG TPA: ribonuclease P protein component [Candidatus Paceibacterota bacterium]|jgi:ribonuclease P protein component|nr:ribonuclease P protein component [Candidatus Paceibacterota bacterium]